MDRLLDAAGAVPPADAATPPIAPTGEQPGAPQPAGTPPVSSSPASPPEAATPPVSPEQIQRWQTAEQRLATLEPQHNQLVRELTQLSQAEQARRAEESAKNARQEAIKQAKIAAANMPPDEAIDFVANAADQAWNWEMARQANAWQQAVQLRDQQTAMALAPLYAEDLGKQHQLRPEYVERLKKLQNPHLMDQYLPVIREEQANAVKWEEQLKRLGNTVDQNNRSQNAAAAQATGIHQPSGVGAMPSAGAPSNVQAGSRAHLMSKIGPLFGYVPADPGQQ